ncbi:hypothetical protein GAYE_SCF18G3886 [Galdieria yellowstonensis]|uniref:K Homology domain-containing protein n=1 Tax=Galdieria yellowstonensis TaxID=3028027 RepID=A0AAV9IF49_9RHOD|nr:hypothetical protein GAYE_SCF18G3886 [Galdieria yellowstonensis]
MHESTGKDAAISRWKENEKVVHRLEEDDDEYLYARISWKKVLSSRMIQFTLDKHIPPDSGDLERHDQSILFEFQYGFLLGGCLALMEASVPIRSPVSGVAVGLIVDNSKVVILADILDGSGDMSFKVAGAADVVTAVQIDMKMAGIESSIIVSSTGSKRIPKRMLDIMPKPKITPPASEPYICDLQIPTESIGDLFGPGGKHIRNILEAFGREDLVPTTVFMMVWFL